MKLIENWRECWRCWSTRLAILGTAITSVLLAFPEAALSVWAIMPVEFKNAIPAQYMPFIGIGVFALSIVARLIKQEGLENAKREES